MRDTQADVKGGGRIVRGQISSSGGIVSGSGFTVVRTGVGRYTITFLQPFKAPPTVEYSFADGNAGFLFLAIASTPNQVAIGVNNAANNAQLDAAVQFAAMEANPA